MNTEQEPPIVQFHDHPDFVGGIKWSELELKWIEARDQKWREAIAKKDAALDASEKDAARYRFLRSGDYPFSFAQRVLNDTPFGIDSAVDAAITQAKKARK